MELNVQKKGKVTKLAQLKQQQRSRIGSSLLRCSEDSNSLNLKSEKIAAEALPIVKNAVSIVQLDENNQRTLPQRRMAPSPIDEPPKNLKVDLSLKRTVTIASKEDLREIRSWLNNTDNNCPGKGYGKMYDLADSLFYWKFPFPDISEEQCRKIAALGGGPEMKVYFREIAGNWRNAFLSLYGTLKGSDDRQRDYFYHIQPGFGALFRHSKESDLEALVFNCGEGFRSILKEEGITFLETSNSSFKSEDLDKMPEEDEIDEEHQEEEEEDQENIDPYNHRLHFKLNFILDFIRRERIREQINARLRKGKVGKIKRMQRSGNHVIIIKDVHMFVDYLLNQKDPRSSVLIPQLIAPMPFVYGALLRNEGVVYGPDVDGLFRLKVQGQVLPGATENILRVLRDHYGEGGVLGVSGETDPRTEALTSFHHL